MSYPRLKTCGMSGIQQITVKNLPSEELLLGKILQCQLLSLKLLLEFLI